MKCDNCNGIGYVIKTRINKKGRTKYSKNFCIKCKGNKELDWLENVLGINNNFNYDRSVYLDKKTKYYIRRVNKLNDL